MEKITVERTDAKWEILNQSNIHRQKFFSNKQDTKSIAGMIKAKIPLLAAALIAIVLGVVYLVSLLYETTGSFTIKLTDQRDRHLSLSETPGFSNGTTLLSAMPMDEMDNITYEWLPEDIDEGFGAHNGENYIAYTFYLKNASEEPVNYKADFKILGATKGIDDAARMMIIRDGEDGTRVPTVYAKKAPDGTTEIVPDGVVDFVSDLSVAVDYERDVPAGEIHKYTVVVWLEGNDPECVDKVLGGRMQFEINFEVVGGDEVVTVADTSAETAN